jgi:hypothetical protein
VGKLLFELATWHGMAKLRLHTETTVQDLENSTAQLGDLLRDFQKMVCPEYGTYDLPTVEAARSRRRTRKAAAPPPTHVHADSVSEEDEQMQKGKKKMERKIRQLNLNSYKLHSLGGYAKAIRQYGTTDNYNSQTVCLFRVYEHYLLLIFCNSRVNSSIDEANSVTSVLTSVGIGKQVRRECYFHRTQALRKAKKSLIEDTLPTVPFHVKERLPPTSPDQHHHISLDTRSKIIIPIWLNQHEDDPALPICPFMFLIQLIQFSDGQLTGFSTTAEESPLGTFVRT